MVFCENCGRKIEENSVVCPVCGFSNDTVAIKDNNRKWWSIMAAFVACVAVTVSLIFAIPRLKSEKELNELIKIINTNSTGSVDEVEDSSLSDVTSKVEYISGNLTCAASSVHISKYRENHSAENAVDGNPQTAWYEGNADYGIGEWVKLVFSKKTISGISIINGHALAQNNYGRYYSNARVKKIRVEAEDFSKEFELNDGTTDFQDVSFGESIETSYVTVTILEVYPGDADKLTCISEIRLIV